ncbi:hypothetical protein ACOMHN_019431 [Nucella lapillus]
MAMATVAFQGTWRAPSGAQRQGHGCPSWVASGDDLPMSGAGAGGGGEAVVMSSFSVRSSVDVGRHLFILHLHVEVLKIINVVWCQFRDFRCKVGGAQYGCYDVRNNFIKVELVSIQLGDNEDNEGAVVITQLL